MLQRAIAIIALIITDERRKKSLGEGAEHHREATSWGCSLNAMFNSRRTVSS